MVWQGESWSTDSLKKDHTRPDLNVGYQTSAADLPIALVNSYIAAGLFVDYFIRGLLRLIPGHSQVLTADTISSLALPGLTNSVSQRQYLPSADNQAPVAAGIGTAQAQSFRADP